MTKILNKIKNLNKNKKSVVALLVAFVTIVGGLVGTSVYLNGKANDETMKTYEKDASSKVILQTENEELLTTFVENKGGTLDKLSDSTYIADFEDADKAAEFKESYEDDESLVINSDDFFEVAAIEDTDIIEDEETSSVDLSESLPKGYTWKQLAQERGQKLVAVIDTGVNSYAIHSENFSTSSSSKDENGHGTVIAKAIYDNANGKSMILGLKAMDDDGSGYMTNIMKAIQYAIDQDVDIINMSIIGDDKGDESALFKSVIQEALDKGIKVVASAGNFNSNSNSYIPANIEGVITVGATNGDSNEKADFSNYGDAIDYYVNAGSTSEAAGIVTGKLVNDEDLSDLVTNKTVEYDKDSVAKEDVKVEKFVAQLAGQGFYVYTNNKGEGYVAAAEEPAKWVSNGTWVAVGNAKNVWVNAAVHSGSGYNGWVATGATLKNTYNYGDPYYGDGTYGFGVGFIPNTSGTTSVTINFRAAKLYIDLDGGSWSGSSSYTATGTDSYIEFTTTPTKTGYTFTGWTLSSGGGSLNGIRYYYGNSDGTIKANWRANSYVLSIDPKGGTYDGSQAATFKKVIYDSGDNNRIGTPSKTGHVFLGWATGQQTEEQLISGTIAGTKLYDASGNAVKSNGYWSNDIGVWKHAGDATVYAQYKRLDFYLTMNLNDSDGTGGIKASLNEIPSTVTVTYGLTNNNVLGKKPQRKGYVFQGWYTATSGGTQVYDKNGNYVDDTAHWKDGEWNLASDITLYAHWTPTTFNVKYENNTSRHVRNGTNISINTYTSDTTQRVEGSVADDTTVTFDKSYSLANNTLSWAGHDWLGWNESSEATSGYANQKNFSYAQLIEENGRYWDYTNECWKDSSGNKVNTVTLYSIWNARQHSITIVPTSEENDDLQEESFTGSWSGTNNETSVSTNGSNSITLTAYWGDKIDLGKAVPSAGHTRTIRYDVNGENVNIDRTSDTVSLYFNRWNYESKDNNIGNRANDIIYDNGTDNAYLTVQDQNSTIVARYYFDTVVLPTPTREGYNFLGWYYDAATTKKATGKNNCRGNGGSIYRTANNETLYARWEQTSYNYSETMETFIQDETDDKPHVYMSKINGTLDENNEPLNTPLTKVKNSVTGEMVGFTIQLYKNSVSSENLVLTLKTDQGVFDKNGDILINYQNDGKYEITNYLEKNVTYVVHEIDPPNGWSLDLDKEVMFDGEHNLEITMEDTPFVSPGGDLLKLDSYGRPLEGAFFKLVEGNSYNENANVILEFTTNEEGKSGYDIYKYCKAGKTYTLHEVKAPEGYELCEDYTFKMPMYSIESLILIQAEDVTKLVKSLKIVKVDSEDNPLSGAEFQLYMKDSNGNLVECYVDSNGDWANVADLTDAQIKEKGYELMKGTTGSDGTVTFNNLPVRASFTGGESNYTKAYYLKETKAPEGYSLLTETFEILIPEDATNKEITYVVKDDSIMLTLEAGGNGYSLYVGLGASLIALAIALSLTKKTKRA